MKRRFKFTFPHPSGGKGSNPKLASPPVVHTQFCKGQISRISSHNNGADYVLSGDGSMQQLSRSSGGSIAPHPPTPHPTPRGLPIPDCRTTQVMPQYASQIARSPSDQTGVVSCYNPQVSIRSSAKCGVHSTGAGGRPVPQAHSSPQDQMYITLVGSRGIQPDLHCREK